MPAYCIPTKKVIKYFDLDIEFLKSIAYLIKRLTMNYLNRCLLLGRYRSTTIIDDNVSCLVIVINDEDDSLIGIKGKIDADENGLIIRAEKISFLSHKERAD